MFLAIGRDDAQSDRGYLKIHLVYFSGSLLKSTGQSSAIPNTLSYHDDPATKRPGLDGSDGAVYAVAGRHHFEYRAAGDVGKPARIAAANGAGHHQLCAHCGRADSTLGLAGRPSGYGQRVPAGGGGVCARFGGLRRLAHFKLAGAGTDFAGRRWRADDAGGTVGDYPHRA